ncbi:MAG: hypothetical protein ACKV1O_14000 [Saprospiraceae bacterium]
MLAFCCSEFPGTNEMIMTKHHAVRHSLLRSTTTITTIFMVCLSVLLNAQVISREISPLFYEGKTLQLLKKDSLVQDLVAPNEVLLYVKIKTPKGHLEYFTLNDSTFYSREKAGDQYSGEGFFSIDFKNITSRDTFITFDPVTYAETINILSVHPLTKTGGWAETAENGERWHGKYVDGKKQGHWNCYTTWQAVFYDNDEITGLFSPDRLTLEKYQQWIVDKKLYWCNRLLQTDQTGTYEREWLLKSTADEKCQKLGVLVLKENGILQFKEYSSKQKFALRPEGSGKWQLNSQGNLELEFSNQKKEVFIIQYWGKDAVRLEVVPAGKN